ncbi:hypothetical protein ACFWD7_55620 [Streptomyces mirabilis]|uniref:hypothetical protein n=1 Tax=Streptomyces mirabilis TaxID=68239 RepID=UPI0036916DD4
MLASVLGTVDGQTRPFGIRQAKPVDKGRVLRVERAKDVEAMLGLLPYRTKKGPWRGVSGLTAQMHSARLPSAFAPGHMSSPGALPFRRYG